MKTTLLSLLIFPAFLLTGFKLAAQPVFEWAVSTGGLWAQADYISNATDSKRNVITIAGFKDSGIDANPGTGTLGFTNSGGLDFYVQKLDENANFKWAKRVGGPSYDIPHQVITDLDDNIYACGSFSNIVEFTDGSGIFLESQFATISCDVYERDAFIMKLDSSGNTVWAKSFGGYSADKACNIVLDDFGNIYCAGTYYDSADFDPGLGIAMLHAGSFSEAYFLAKFDNNGNYIWAKNFIPGGSISINSIGLDVDSDNNVVMAQYAEGTMDLDPGAATSLFNYAEGGFVTKLDPTGNSMWIKTFDSLYFFNLTIDNADNICLVGMFADTCDVDPGPGIYNLTSNGWFDTFLFKLDKNGNFKWGHTLGDADDDYCWSVTTDNLNNVYTTGLFDSFYLSPGTPVDMDPGSGTFYLNISEAFDSWVRILDSNGVFKWACLFAGYWDEQGHDVTIDNANNILLTGYYAGTIDFNPGPLADSLTASGGDVYTVKLSQPNMPTTQLEKTQYSPIVNAWPNPTNGCINLELKETAFIEIISFEGKKVISKNLQTGLNQLDISNLSNGVYMLIAVTTTGNNSFKLVKQ